MNGLARTALFYFLVFAGTGVSLPFIALWFKDKGMSGAEISVVLAAPMLARLLMGPLIAVWGDSFRWRRTPMAILCAVAALSFAAMGLVDGLALWLPLWFVGATAIASIGVILGAHAFNYGFSTLVWRGQGISERTIGFLWATGVVAEIAFMWFLEPLRARLGPWAMLCVGGVAAVARWTAMAFAPPLELLWALQSLHALSFAAVFLAGLQIVERLSPPQSLSVAQTLSSALSSGVLLGIGTIVSGPLFDRYGAGGYLAMSVMALLGLAGAFTLRRELSEASAP